MNESRSTILCFISTERVIKMGIRTLNDDFCNLANNPFNLAIIFQLTKECMLDIQPLILSFCGFQYLTCSLLKFYLLIKSYTRASCYFKFQWY